MKLKHHSGKQENRTLTAFTRTCLADKHSKPISIYFPSKRKRDPFLRNMDLQTNTLPNGYFANCGSRGTRTHKAEAPDLQSGEPPIAQYSHLRKVRDSNPQVDFSDLLVFKTSPSCNRTPPKT